MFEKVTQRMILLRNTQQRQNVFVQIHHKTVRKEGSLMKCFSTLEEKFLSLRGHVISPIYSSSKLKTKHEVISRYPDPN